MYGNGYPRTAFALQTKGLHRSKSKSCGYYMRIVFFFSSLIQTLIIVSLVLFLVYGQPEKSAEEKHVDELSENFKRVSLDNLQLRKDKADLGSSLGKTTGEKDTLQKEVDKLKVDLETSNNNTEAEKQKLGRCVIDKRKIEMTRSTPIQCPTPPMRNPFLKSETEKHHERYRVLVEQNYTLKVEDLQKELSSAAKARDEYQMSAIEARRERDELREQLKRYTSKCKEEFSKPLEGIKEVTRAFLNKINSIFPHSLTFHLTCDKQQDQLDKIRSNCTNLSRQVETKFQAYLDRVGDEVARLQGDNSALEVTSERERAELQSCKEESVVLRERKTQLDRDAAQKYDREMQEHLNDKRRLRLDIEVQNLKLEQCNSKLSSLVPRLPPLPKPFVPPIQLGGTAQSGLKDYLKKEILPM